MRDYLDIIRRNLMSPIVIAIFLLALALLYAGERRDAWFISVVIAVNTIIGVVQEVRAKYALKQLELMSAPRARLVRGDEVAEVMYDALQVGDEILLEAGDELPADGIVLSARGLEVNESMLTGESASIDKKKHDEVYAATTVIAGSARVRVTAVGDATKAGAISATLKQYTPRLTPLQQAIQNAITFLTYCAIVLSLLVFARYRIAGFESVRILKTIITSAITIVPEGLLLASSLLLAFGSLKLAQAKVLPQKLSAIEAMALLNILCTDKTGTLTSDEITLERVEPFGSGNEPVKQLAAMVAHETSGGNATGQAIITALDLPYEYTVDDILAFSSARKFAGVRARVDGRIRTLIMGAPEYVARMAPLSTTEQQQIEKWTDDGLRVLLLAEFNDNDTPLKSLKPGSGRPLAVILLRNLLRDGVVDTVAFLQRQGVNIRVISGDNPRTVQYVARAAGINNPDTAITGAELAELDEPAFATAADQHTIFARVLPEQKEHLIAHFSQQNHQFTGMVGDGVNDALALKKADLGVAMYAGAPASRRVADIILLNNSFNSLPLGMRLGNQIMQAIEVIATLFFHKIIYGLVLLAVTLVLGVIHPYAPRHITFLNIFLVTMPTIMWTLFPPRSHHRINPHNFWRDTLGAVTPIALVSGAAVSITYLMLRAMQPHDQDTVSTMTVLVATFFGVYLVFLVGPMLGVVLDRRAKTARMLYIAAALLVASTSFAVPLLRRFFDFTIPTLAMIGPVAGVVVIAALLQWHLARRAGKIYQNR
ncbi:HAD-IC family P-type ATPase [Candidatus Saccharibacteria bacterium]|jgi:HAD ATPase, P-type, family IC|nr:HAD-IC family P-type ATPase [Candidatus Saccharibacteria bacterium]